MTKDQMLGQFWAFIGRDATAGRVPGAVIGSNPAGPDAAGLIYLMILKMWRAAKPVQGRYPGTVSLSSGTGVGPYSLPTDFMDWLPDQPPSINGYPLEIVRQTDIRQRAALVTPSSGTLPAYIYEIGKATATPFARRFQVWPAPASSLTLDLDYLRLPLTLGATGISGSTEYPDLPADFHLAPVAGAAQLFYLNNPELPRPDAFAAWGGVYAEGLAGLQAATREETRPATRMRTPSPMDTRITSWMEIDC